MENGNDQMQAMKDYLASIFIRANVSDEEVEKWELAELKRNRFVNFKKTVPERYLNESVDTYTAETPEQKRALELTERFIKSVNENRFATLIFLGSVGTGKTHLACSTIRECGGQYRIASEICAEIKSAKSFSSKQTEKSLLEDYSNAKLLVIDEIGRGAAASDEQYMLYQVINARYNRKRPTLLISNMTKKDFINYIGIATSDRIVESGKIMEFQGQSYRAKLRAVK